MKKIKLSILYGISILVMFSAIGMADLKKVRFELPYKKEIHGEVIDVKRGSSYLIRGNNIIYGEVEMTVKEARKLGVKGLEEKKDKEKVKVGYPKVVITKSPESREWVHYPASIRFFNKKGELIKEYHLQRGIPGVRHNSKVFFSKNRRYIGVNNTNVKEEAETIILDTNDRILWEAKHNLFDIHISPNGKYIVGSPTAEWLGGSVGIYNEKGLVKEIRQESRIWDMDFFEDSKHFAIAVVQDGSWVLILCDENGNEVWRREGIIKGGF